MATDVLTTVFPEVQVAPGVVLTDSAASKLRGILEERGLADTHGLRVFVQGGGCGGMKYGMTFEDAPREDDEVSQQYGLRVCSQPQRQAGYNQSRRATNNGKG